MKTKLLLGVAAVAVLVGAGALWRSRGAPASGSAPLRISFLQGARQAYGLRIDSTLRFASGSAGEPRTIRQRIAGTLQLRVLEADEGGARVALQLGEARLSLDGRSSDALDRQLGQLFLVSFSADGAPERFEFPADLAEEAQTVLEEAIRTFQVVVPPGAAGAWRVEEQHASGRYRAAYRSTADGRILKSKVAYLAAADGAAAATQELRVHIRRADATIVLDPRASWLERMVAEEELVVFLGEGRFADSSLSAELGRVPLLEAQTALDLDAAPASYSELSAALASRGPAPQTAPRQGQASGDVRALPEVVRALEASDGRGAALLYELRDLLRRDPGAAAQVLAVLRAGASSGTAAALLNALGMASTEEAQAALRAVLEEPEFSGRDRLRAVLSLGSAAEPGVESLAALRRLADDPRARSEGLAEEAVLSLGIAGNTLRRARADLYTEVRDDLVRRVETAADANAAATALLALGNAHDTALAQAASARLADPDPQVRSAAVHALGKLGGAAEPDALAQRLAVEEHAAVRSEFAAALNALPRPGAAALALVDAALAREGDPRTRYDLARLLGENLETYPAGRTTLAALSSSDPSKQVRTYAAHALWGRR
jgi:hypothetical protein